MVWNWTQHGWPHFAYDPVTLEPLERRFLLLAGEVIGAVRHVSDGERDLLRIELLSDEAVKTSAIEGETLDRLGVQSSLRRQLGLDTDNRNVKPKERGIAEMMVDLYRSWADPLDANTLFRWHHMLMAHSRHLETIGGYRGHAQALAIGSAEFNLIATAQGGAHRRMSGGVARLCAIWSDFRFGSGEASRVAASPANTCYFAAAPSPPALSWLHLNVQSAVPVVPRIRRLGREPWKRRTSPRLQMGHGRAASIRAMTSLSVRTIVVPNIWHALIVLGIWRSVRSEQLNRRATSLG